MAGFDNEVFNTRERPLSNDLNDLQSLTHRMILDAFREMLARRSFSLGSTPGESPRNVVLGGLEVSPSGSDIAVAPGAILQDSTTLSPTPGSLDSSYRIGAIRSAATVTPPSPGSDTWYILEAQMTETTTSSESRDIFDPGSSSFVPTIVPKQLERRLTFQLTAGTSTDAPAPTGGDWVPIAIVFRPAGGGAVSASHLIDVRQMWDALSSTQRDDFKSSVMGLVERTLATTHRPGGAVSETILLAASVLADPQRLWYSRSGALDVTASTVLEPGTVLAADTWYYLYLCPWQGLAPSSPRDASATGKGVLVLSDTTPTNQGEKRNGGTLTLPPPYSTGTVATGSAVCVGALLRNSTNDGWTWTESVGRDEMRISPQEAYAAVPSEATWTAVDLDGIAPKTAKTAKVVIYNESPGTGTGHAFIAVSPTSGGTTSKGELYAYGMTNVTNGQNFRIEADIPLLHSTQFYFQIDLIAGSYTGMTDCIVDVVGWSE